MLLAAHVTDSGKQSIPPPSAELAIAISTKPSSRQDHERCVKRGIAHEVPSASGFKFGCSFPHPTVFSIASAPLHQTLLKNAPYKCDQTSVRHNDYGEVKMILKETTSRIARR